MRPPALGHSAQYAAPPTRTVLLEYSTRRVTFVWRWFANSTCPIRTHRLSCILPALAAFQLQSHTLICSVKCSKSAAVFPGFPDRIASPGAPLSCHGFAKTPGSAKFGAYCYRKISFNPARQVSAKASAPSFLPAAISAASRIASVTLPNSPSAARPNSAPRFACSCGCISFL